MSESFKCYTPSTNTPQNFSECASLFLKNQSTRVNNFWDLIQNIQISPKVYKRRSSYQPMTPRQTTFRSRIISNNQKSLKKQQEDEMITSVKSTDRGSDRFYINFTADNDQERIIKRNSMYSSLKNENQCQIIQESDFFQQTANEKIQYEYIKNQIESNKCLQKRLVLLKQMFKQTQKRKNQSSTMQKQEKIRNKLNLPYLVQGIKKLKDKRHISKVIKVKRGNGYVSSEGVLVAQSFIEMKKNNQNQIDLYDKIYGDQKYDMKYSDYLKKRTSKRIEQQFEKRQKNKKQNTIYQFQNYLMHHIILSEKNKESVLKGFQQINKHIQKINV